MNSGMDKDAFHVNRVADVPAIWVVTIIFHAFRIRFSIIALMSALIALVVVQIAPSP